MCSPCVTLQPICRPHQSADHIHCWGSKEEPNNFRFAINQFCWYMYILCLIEQITNDTSNYHPQARRGPGPSLSPRFSNWNLSLQSERVQGLAGYCTQGPEYSSDLHQPHSQCTVLHNFYTKMWLNELSVLRMTRKMKPCSCRVGLCC